jgi:hypothetical protein
MPDASIEGAILPVEKSMPVQPSISTADGRDLRIDACRGLALIFIFLDHIPGNILSWLTLRNYGFSDTTEVFVFVSGYTCMIAYGGGLPRLGWGATIVRAVRRAWEIYVAFLLLLLAYLSFVLIAGAGRYLDDTNTAVFFSHPTDGVIRAVSLQYMPVNTDVLPTFVLLHLCFPALLWLLGRSPHLTLVASVVLYISVQLLGWDLPAWPEGGWYFNPLAWQLLFVFGAWYATDASKRLQRLAGSRFLLSLAALYLVFGLAVSISWHVHALETFMPHWLSQLIYPIDKSSLAPVRVLHFLALAVVVPRLLRRNWPGLSSPLMTALVRCGENSLALYCLGVLLAFAAHVWLTQQPSGVAMQIVVSATGTALMIAAATLLTWAAKLDQRGPKLF